MVTLTCAPPRYFVAPRAHRNRAEDVFEMAALVDFELDPWQRLVIEGACGERTDGKWAAREVGVNVPRQNGKGGILELIELTALFVWLPELESTEGERLIIHSAHEFITSQKHSQRLWSLIERTPELLKQVVNQRMVGTHGQEAIRLVDDRKIEFRTRTKGGGRGFSCDLLVLDEAMFLPESSFGALLPTLRARPNPQIWYTGSAVDQEVHEDGRVFTRVRDRAISGTDPVPAYFEWSLPYDDPNLVTVEEMLSEEAMASSNPAYGIRIFREHFEMEIAALDNRTAAVELFGVGDYPDPHGSSERKISPESWAECENGGSEIVGDVCFAFDTSPERQTSIAAAGRNQWGLWHVEIIERLPGTGWLPERLAELQSDHNPISIVYDELGPSASLVKKCDDKDIELTPMNGAEHAQACGLIVDAVNEQNLNHLGSAELWNAIRGSATRPLGDRWLWSRSRSSVNISPLVAATLALWAAMGQPEDDGSGMVIY